MVKNTTKDAASELHSSYGGVRTPLRTSQPRGTYPLTPSDLLRRRHPTFDDSDSCPWRQSWRKRRCMLERIDRVFL